MRPFALLVLTVACDSAVPPVAPTTEVITGFTIGGDPASTSGATWTFKGTYQGITYDLQGILIKPAGAGPYPAVIMSHGFGGNSLNFSRNAGRRFADWGMVVIATNYTHAANVPLGAPGLETERGASAPNMERANMTMRLLAALDYVDTTRLAAHGHSMGAFVTTALTATYGHWFKAASHTAGGVRTDGIAEAAAPTEAQARAIRVPYQLHHGDRDVVVPLAMGERQHAAMTAVRELHVYAGLDHDDMPMNALMLERVRAWYVRHGILR
jgi:dienelactone hydrolase